MKAAFVCPWNAGQGRRPRIGFEVFSPQDRGLGHGSASSMTFSVHTRQRISPAVVVLGAVTMTATRWSLAGSTSGPAS